MVTFLNYNFLFIILFLLSQPSFHPYIFFSFFFSSTHVVLISIPLLLFSLSSSFKKVPGVALALILSIFFSNALSLFFFFFLLDSRKGYFRKSAVRALFSLAFSSWFGRMNFVGPGEKIFSRVFLHPYFPPYVFHPP